MISHPEGRIEGLSAEGVAFLSSWKRSAITGWTLGISQSVREFTALLYWDLAFMGAIIALTLAAYAAIAALTANLTAGWLNSLTKQLIQLGHGQKVHVPDSPVLEIEQLAGSLNSASNL